jgi:hypothetical protein
MILALGTRDLVGEIFNETLEKHLTDGIDEIVLFNEFEHEYTSFNTNGFEDLVDFANKHSIPVKIVNGSRNNLHLLYDKSNPRYNIIVEIIYWPTIFFTHTYYIIDHRMYDFSSPIIFGDKYTFLSMNNNSHDHRCLMMDLFAKYNLIRNQAITWHGRYFCATGGKYDFKYWTPTILKFNEGYQDRLNILNYVNEYNLSFIEVVNESTENLHFLTEKTVKPLFFGKPFVVFGAKGFHEWLVELGFKLYDELFDYSFDSIENTEDRFEMIVQQIKKLDELSITEKKNLFDTIKEKIEYNRSYAVELATDYSLAPEYVKFLYRSDTESIIYNRELDNIIMRLINEKKITHNNW